MDLDTIRRVLTLSFQRTARALALQPADIAFRVVATVMANVVLEADRRQLLSAAAKRAVQAWPAMMQPALFEGRVLHVEDVTALIDGVVANESPAAEERIRDLARPMVATIVGAFERWQDGETVRASLFEAVIHNLVEAVPAPLRPLLIDAGERTSARGSRGGDPFVVADVPLVPCEELDVADALQVLDAGFALTRPTVATFRPSAMTLVAANALLNFAIALDRWSPLHRLGDIAGLHQSLRPGDRILTANRSDTRPFAAHPLEAAFDADLPHQLRAATMVSCARLQLVFDRTRPSDRPALLAHVPFFLAPPEDEMTLFAFAEDLFLHSDWYPPQTRPPFRFFEADGTQGHAGPLDMPFIQLFMGNMALPEEPLPLLRRYLRL